MNLTIPFRTFLFNEKASVRLTNMLWGATTKWQMITPNKGLTLSQFINEWPLERLRKDVFGFGPKTQAELCAMLERHVSCKTGRRFANYVATLKPKEPERTCVHCGCTDSRACSGGCFWTEKHGATATGVCSRCVSVVQTGPLRPFRIGSFIFTRTSPMQVFIQSPPGEGMQTTDAKLDPLIHQFFNREF